MTNTPKIPEQNGPTPEQVLAQLDTLIEALTPPVYRPVRLLAYEMLPVFLPVLRDTLHQQAAELAQARAQRESFQTRVQQWCVTCFGPTIAADVLERNHRFLEEALELVQALGCTQEEAHQLVDYVFGRPVGEPAQELGGVMVTIAALAVPNGLDMEEAAETELARVWMKVEKIRAKHAAKPRYGPLPGHSEALASAEEGGES